MEIVKARPELYEIAMGQGDSVSYSIGQRDESVSPCSLFDLSWFEFYPPSQRAHKGSINVFGEMQLLFSVYLAVNWPQYSHSEKAIWKGKKPVTFNESFPVLQGWFNECRKEHKCLALKPRGLPKRLLRISKGLRTKVRLEEQSVFESGFYAALSYCWGSSSDFCTTRANYNEYLQSIPTSQLPKTVGDAVEVAWRLGFSLLWVDRYCIIQDDDRDWERESARMASVYMNAHITIAATASADANHGFLFPRLPARHFKVYPHYLHCLSREVSVRRRLELPKLWTTDRPKRTAYVRPEAEELHSLGKSPLYRRGWTLQETTLSNRVVHFAEDQLFWACRERVRSEDGTYDARHSNIMYDFSTKESAHESWWTWVEAYSRRTLSKPRDKFAAMAGLTKNFQYETGCEPAAGL
ncbi:heterokaryon incompatibility protein-domain-containing protein [Aspergillus sergii]|uniref:Heterokaryon incompatibility protein-domain-containing protein n=1 Tax=Aspergillus sergii TaxID=1034303 RepID=A0A5N6X7C5_9EURO|nr:heterokaryon incompatibility protein-domain-containing protein [Aspergillus sergii]